jgi:hypothetical protein
MSNNNFAGISFGYDSDKIFKEEYKTVKHVNTHHRKGIDVTYNVPKENCIFILPKAPQQE